MIHKCARYNRQCLCVGAKAESGSTHAQSKGTRSIMSIRLVVVFTIVGGGGGGRGGRARARARGEGGSCRMRVRSPGVATVPIAAPIHRDQAWLSSCTANACQKIAIFHPWSASLSAKAPSSMGAASLLTGAKQGQRRRRGAPC